ncbi:hypothetical protein Tco_1365730 [Tanacetum coccineum]
MAESSSHNPPSPEITPKKNLSLLTNPKAHTLSYLQLRLSSPLKRLPLPPTMKALTQYKEYLSEFWYTAKTLEDSKVWVSTPTGGVRGDIGYSGEIGAKGTLKKSCLPSRWRLLMANGVQVDYAKLIWENLIHKLNKKTKEKIVPYSRFISLLLEHMMPEYDNEELTINPTQDMDEGTKNYSFDHIFAWSNLSVLVDKTKSDVDGLKPAYSDSVTNKDSRANDISKKIKLEDLSKFLKDTRSAFFTPDSP